MWNAYVPICMRAKHAPMPPQANYQRTVLSAIEDVDNAVVGYNAEHARVEQLIAQSEQSRRAADLARIRYQGRCYGLSRTA
jgi:outer membrane protein TolC